MRKVEGNVDEVDAKSRFDVITRKASVDRQAARPLQ